MSWERDRAVAVLLLHRVVGFTIMGSPICSCGVYYKGLGLWADHVADSLGFMTVPTNG